MPGGGSPLVLWCFICTHSASSSHGIWLRYPLKDTRSIASELRQPTWVSRCFAMFIFITIFKTLQVKIMLCSKLHCPKALKLKVFLYEIVQLGVHDHASSPCLPPTPTVEQTVFFIPRICSGGRRVPMPWFRSSGGRVAVEPWPISPDPPSFGYLARKKQRPPRTLQ